MSGVSIVIPAYNEAQSLAQTLDEVSNSTGSLNMDHEILVIDDGSTDATRKIALEKKVNVISHEQNKGYGASLKTGIRRAKYEYILIIDADSSYPAKEISTLIENIKDNDMVVGARIGRDVTISILRRFAKAILNLLANYLSETKIPDLNSGFRIIKKDVVLKFFHILPNGFSFTTTITLALLVNSYNIFYVPINYYRRKGYSKFHPIKDTMNYFFLIIRTIMYFNPLKIFLPISLFVFLLGMFIFLYSYFFTPKVMDISTIVCIISAIQIAVIGLLADLIDKRLQG